MSHGILLPGPLNKACIRSMLSAPLSEACAAVTVPIGRSPGPRPNLRSTSPAASMDLGIVIALREELREFMAFLPVEHTVVRDSQTGQYGYIFETPITHQRCIATLIGEMNPEPAALQTERLLARWSPRTVVMLGIAAGIHPDVRVGDVIIASQVDNYLASAKGQAGSPPESFEFSLGGTVFHADHQLLTQVRNFEFVNPQAFSRWRQECAESLKSLVADEKARRTLRGQKLVRDVPDLLDAHLASDSVVGAAQQFTQWLRSRRDRNLKALDMESSGLMMAAVKRMNPARTLIIRGVSDYGDERKSGLDALGDGTLRQYAMLNATRLLWELLEAGTWIPGRAEPDQQELPQTGSTPSYPDDETRTLSLQLEAARERKIRLRTADVSTRAVDQEIRNLRRRIREGGQLRAGDSLDDGRFLLIEPVGSGGFGQVWKARDRERNEDVAIKVLHTNLAGHKGQRERFFRGARRMAELRHPAVVRVIEQYGEDHGYYYYVMEFVRGLDFRQVILNKTLARSKVLPIIIRVGEALALAHSRGVIHRDIKPSNILINDTQEPLLTDFDLVGGVDTTGGTKTGALGTVVYAAPECLNRPQDATASADVYGLGMTAIFGFHGADLPLTVLRSVEPVITSLSCHEAVTNALRRATNWEPGMRHQDAGQFVAELKSASVSPRQVRHNSSPDKLGSDILTPLGSAYIVVMPPSTERLRTPQAHAILTKWFIPAECDTGRIPRVLLERLLALIYMSTDERAVYRTFIRSNEEESLVVKFLELPEQTDSQLWTLVFHEFSHSIPLPEEFARQLTQRQIEVAKGMLRNWSNEQIAAELGLSLSTVRTHAREIFVRLKLDGRADLMYQVARFLKPV